jgi:hypothetical protein
MARRRRTTRRRKRRRSRKAKGGFPTHLLLLGGLGLGAYYFLSKKPLAASAEQPKLYTSYDLSPQSTIAAMMPSLIMDKPNNYAEAKQQLDDIKTLWKSGKIATPKEADVRLGSLAGHVSVLLGQNKVTTKEAADITVQINSFRQEVNPTKEGAIAKATSSILSTIV